MVVVPICISDRTCLPVNMSSALLPSFWFLVISTLDTHPPPSPYHDSDTIMYTRSSTTLLVLFATLLALPHTLAATPAVEDVLDNPPPFYPQHTDFRSRSKNEGRDGVAVMGKCEECRDKMRKCTAVSGRIHM
jgi:hypothetical protein